MKLANKFIISMPNMVDPFFEKKVVLICEHNNQSTMGFVINQKTKSTVIEVFEQLFIDCPEHCTSSVYFGGPVSEETGFMLHEENLDFKSTMKIGQDIYLTSSIDILESISISKLKGRWKFILGYSGWVNQQLEQEISDGSWLISESLNDLIFSNSDSEIWQNAISELGISDPNSIADIGHA